MKRTRIAAIIASMILCLSAAGCASVNQNSGAADNSVSQTADNNAAAEKSANEKGSASAVSASAAKIDTSDIFSNRDLKQEADLTDAKTLTVKDGETLDITEEGVYVIKGSAKNCTIKVTADKEAKVQLVLDGVTVENDDFPAIYVVSADKVFVTTTSSENTLSVTGDFKADGDTNTDAVIFSKDDLVFNGTGTLTVTSAKANGISGKDDIKFTGGTYNITSAKDSIEAHDSISIADGTFVITSQKDGLHAENDDDDTVGYIYISGGSFKITAKSDAIQATTAAQIDGGTFELKAAEGIEATGLQINGGEISISASDDGVNAAKKSKSYGTPSFEMNGGTLKITMSGNDTDAIDANGNVIVTGGTIDITSDLMGSSESFDYDGTATYTGGTIIINGEQVSEIPTPMMMGGGRGGMGNMKGGDRLGGQGNRFGGNGEMTPPEGFDPDNLPEDFDPENLPEDFNKGGFRDQNGDGTDGQKQFRKRMKQNTEQDSSTSAANV